MCTMIIIGMGVDSSLTRFKNFRTRDDLFSNYKEILALNRKTCRSLMKIVSCSEGALTLAQGVSNEVSNH